MSKTEVVLELNILGRNKASGPDLLSPSLFKDGGVRLLSELTKLLQTIWETDEGSRSPCDNHRGISLVSVASRLLTGLIVRRLTKSRESQIREEQAGFRSGRGCVDHIFTLQQISEHRHSYRQPTVVIFLDLRATFGLVARNVLWICLLRKGVRGKYMNLLRSLYAHSASRVRVYEQLSRAFITSSGVLQGCPFSPFLSDFVIDDILDGALRESRELGVELLPGTRLTDLEYADDIVLLSPSSEDMQTMLNKEDINRLAVFDHRCIRQMAHIKWADRVSNVVVRRRAFRNAWDTRSIGQLITLHSSRWLGHVLRMPAERLPYRALYTEATNGWVKPRGDRATTWSLYMKTLTARLSKSHTLVIQRSMFLEMLWMHHPTLPRDLRTLMCTPLGCPKNYSSSSAYLHFGLEKALLRHLSLPSNSNCTSVQLQFHIDGVSSFNALKTQVWPILGRAVSSLESEPFIATVCARAPATDCTAICSDQRGMSKKVLHYLPLKETNDYLDRRIVEREVVNNDTSWICFLKEDPVDLDEDNGNCVQCAFWYHYSCVGYHRLNVDFTCMDCGTIEQPT
ncbi:uncharacterized protein DEA37_0013448 [Paragonimus westermani]|uniref:Reverse transcriptase domain-containing protein n=1 Tax=Paragonimus westermani TaxID=34504 RepID=A0A5J4P2E0_9TREM|nr:uncharacterized protein DEA37_0013448 [Paragonimus westermani]